MTMLAPAGLEKLAQVCGMFGSSFAGECASAAAHADRILSEAGLTCDQLLSRADEPSPRPAHTSVTCYTPFDNVARFEVHLTACEEKFLRSLTRRWKPLTARQKEVVEAIHRQVTGAAR